MELKKDIAAGAAVSLATTYMMFISSVIDIYVTNKDEFWFDIFKLFPPIFLQFIIAEAANLLLLGILLFISKKVYRIVLITEFTLFVILYLHGNIFLGGISSFSGDSGTYIYRRYKLLSVIIILVLTAGIILLLKKLKYEKTRKTITLVSAFMIGVLLLSNISETIIYKGLERKSGFVVTTKDMWEYSDDENFIIFILDAIGNDNFYNAVQEYNDYSGSDVFRDFTYYSNTAGKYPFTQFALVQILTGRSYVPTESFSDFCRSSFNESRLLNTLYDSGYKMQMYEILESLYATFEIDDNILGKFSNCIVMNSDFASHRRLYKTIDRTVLYRYLPYFLKPYVRTDLIDYAHLQDIGADTQVYSDMNLSFYEYEKEAEIVHTDNKVFKLIHIEGGHRSLGNSKYILDRNMDMYDGAFTYEAMAEQQLGCCMLVDNYLELLKENGVYDNSTIIVMSDHGARISKEGEYNTLEYGCNPILFIKQKNETSDSCRVSSAPVTYDDLEECFMRLLNGYGSDEVFDCKEGDVRSRYYYYYEKTDDIRKDNKYITEYEVIGDVSDPSKTIYNPTENVYEANINRFE